MSISFLKINDKIELVFPEWQNIIGLIQEIGEDYLYIAIPINQTNLKSLIVGNNVEAIITNKDKIVGFKVRIIGKRIDNIPMYKLKIFSEFYEIQRRDNVRMACSFSIYYSTDINKIDQQQQQDYNEYFREHFKEGIMLDISAGGAYFSTKERLDNNSNIIIGFQLEKDYFILKARIIYLTLNYRDNIINYHYGIEFCNISQKNTEKIVCYIFEKMRRQINV